MSMGSNGDFAMFVFLGIVLAGALIFFLAMSGIVLLGLFIATVSAGGSCL